MLLKKMKTTLFRTGLMPFAFGLLCSVGVSAQVCNPTQSQQVQEVEDDTLTILSHQLADLEVSAKRVQQTTLSTDIVGNEALNKDNTGQNLPY
jgi:hypothetical protein